MRITLFILMSFASLSIYCQGYYGAMLLDGEECEQYYNDVSLLVHGDGNYTDYSSSPSTLSAFGNANHSATEKKYGSGSLYMDGDGDYFTAPSASKYQFGTGDFTIEAWVRFSSFPGGNGGGIGNLAHSGSADVRGVALWFLSATDFRLRVGRSVAGQIEEAIYNPNFNTGQWYHLAGTRTGTTLRLFVDGTQVATGSSSANINSTLVFAIGLAHPEATGNTHAYIDEVRVTKGIARYTGNFTPQGGPFEDCDTVP